MTHWQSPNYFSWFPGTTSMPGILAEMLIAALNMVGFSWQSSPVSTELEMVSFSKAAAAESPATAFKVSRTQQ